MNISNPNVKSEKKIREPRSPILKKIRSKEERIYFPKPKKERKEEDAP